MGSGGVEQVWSVGVGLGSGCVGSVGAGGGRVGIGGGRGGRGGYVQGRGERLPPAPSLNNWPIVPRQWVSSARWPERAVALLREIYLN